MDMPVCRPACMGSFKGDVLVGRAGQALQRAHVVDGTFREELSGASTTSHTEGSNMQRSPFGPHRCPIARTCPHRSTTYQSRFAQAHKANLDPRPSSLMLGRRLLRTPKPGVASSNPAAARLAGPNC